MHLARNMGFSDKGHFGGLSRLALCIANILAFLAISASLSFAQRGDTDLIPIPAHLCTKQTSEDPLSYDGAMALFVNGCFDDAVTGAVRLGQDETLDTTRRAQALGLAARASLARFTVAPLSPSASAWIDAGLTHARNAVALDPAVLEAHLQIAIGLGMLARGANPVDVLKEDFATEARSHIEAAEKLAPDDPWLLAVDGGWHLEVVTGAGGVAASMLYGASTGQGMKSIERARAQPDASLMIDVQYAVALLALNPKRYRDTAETVLAEAEKKTPANALERYHLDLAKNLRTRLDAGVSRREVALLVTSIQGRVDRAATASN